MIPGMAPKAQIYHLGLLKEIIMNQYQQTQGQKGFFGRLWWIVDGSRRLAMNLLWVSFLCFGLFIFLVLLFAGGESIVPDTAALVIAPEGVIVEQLEGDPLDRAMAEVLGEERPETLLWDILDALEEAENDDRISAVLLNLNGLAGAIPSHLATIHQAVLDFRQSGKTVIAVADHFTNSRYLIASAADEIHTDEMGLFLLTGYGVYHTYYKEGIDRLEVDWNIFRVGEYKSAVEPFIRNDMSPEAKEANLDWLGDLWGSFKVTSSAARNLSPEIIDGFIDNIDAKVNAAGGRSSVAALEAGLIDSVGGRTAVRARLTEIVGSDGNGSFNQVGFLEYLEEQRPPSFMPPMSNNRVALVVASGTILDGDHPPGTIGGDTVARLVRRARLDDGIKAIILRVNSGGGSAFASEVIRRELAQAREDGKPVVVSMGGVAASGGYWISMASDKVFAEPETITGSIGIFGMFPTFEKPLQKHLGVRTDGVGTNWLAGALDPTRTLDPRAGQMIQTMVDQGYEQFIQIVADARPLDIEAVEKVAGGRVWSGEDAYKHKLVDELGGLDEALAAAKTLAGLKKVEVQLMEEELDFSDRMLIEMMSAAVDLGGPRTLRKYPWLAWITEQSEMLSEFNDPRGVYAHCLCGIR